MASFGAAFVFGRFALSRRYDAQVEMAGRKSVVCFSHRLDVGVLGIAPRRHFSTAFVMAMLPFSLQRHAERTDKP